MARVLSCGPRTCGGKRTDNSSASDNRNRDDENDCGGAGVVGAEQPAGHQHEDGAEERRRAAGGRRDRVHRHHLIARYHVRQRRRQTRRDEAGETVDDQRAEQDRQVVRARPRAARRCRATSTSRPRFAPISTSRRSQRSSSAPANGPSTEYGRYSTANAAGDLPRAGGAVGVEQKPARQTRLEQAVTELARPSAVRAVARIRAGRAPTAKGPPVRGASTTGIHSTNIPAGRACSPP